MVTEKGLRFDDEFVRHKILDAVDDLALAGAVIFGGFVGHCSGHRLNNKMLREPLQQNQLWHYTTVLQATEHWCRQIDDNTYENLRKRHRDKSVSFLRGVRAVNRARADRAFLFLSGSDGSLFVCKPNPHFFMEVEGNRVAQRLNQSQGTSHGNISSHHVAHTKGYSHMDGGKTNRLFHEILHHDCIRRYQYSIANDYR